MRLLSLSVLALGAALALGPIAVAQDAPPPPGAHQMPDHEAMRARMQAHMAAHIKAFHDALNIRAEQEGAFNAAVAALSPDEHPGDHPGDHDGMEDDHAAMAAMTTPERLDAMSRRMEEHMARMREHMQRVTGAVKTLYAALSPDQRRTFDALMTLMGPGHEMGGMGHEHGMDHDHMGPMGPMGDHPH